MVGAIRGGEYWTNIQYRKTPGLQALQWAQLYCSAVFRLTSSREASMAKAKAKAAAASSATKPTKPTKATKATMKVAQIPKPGADFQIVEREIPTPTAGHVRIKVQA